MKSLDNDKNENDDKNGDKVGEDRRDAGKFRGTLKRYDPSTNADQNASHEWTRRLCKAWTMIRMRKKRKKKMRRAGPV